VKFKEYKKLDLPHIAKEVLKQWQENEVCMSKAS